MLRFHDRYFRYLEFMNIIIQTFRQNVCRTSTIVDSVDTMKTLVFADIKRTVPIINGYVKGAYLRPASPYRVQNAPPARS